MQYLLAIAAPIAALVGVVIGQRMSARTQKQNREEQRSLALREERRDAVVSFLASVRRYRRFAMYTEREFKIIPPSENSKGTVIVEGRAEYDSALDEAYTRL